MDTNPACVRYDVLRLPCVISGGLAGTCQGVGRGMEAVGRWLGETGKGQRYPVSTPASERSRSKGGGGGAAIPLQSTQGGDICMQVLFIIVPWKKDNQHWWLSPAKALSIGGCLQQRPWALVAVSSKGLEHWWLSPATALSIGGCLQQRPWALVAVLINDHQH